MKDVLLAALYGRMPEAVGFDFFTVHRGLEFGQRQRLTRVRPPQSRVLQGDFDEAAIGAALAGRSFTRETLDGAPLWCGPIGCENSSTENLSARNPSDPFGGYIGQSQQLVLVEPDTLLSSASYGVVQAMLAGSRSGDDSILSLPEYQAAAEAITARGTLLQAVLIQPGVVDEAHAQKGRSGRPRCALAVIAQVRDTEDILTLVGLAYPNELLAARASDMLLPAFRASRSYFSPGRPFSEAIADYGGAIAQGQTFVSPTNDYAVALLKIRSPMGTPEPDADAEEFARPIRMSGLVLKLLVGSLIWMDDIPCLIPSEP